MAHQQQREFMNMLFTTMPHKFIEQRVLEIGSLNINGTVRDFFIDCDYIGCDLAEGPGVDVVAEGQELTYPDRDFDVVISAECFEHNPFWRETFKNMTRMSRDLVIFTCATTGRAEHGTRRTTPTDSPFTLDWDYYQNLTEDDFRRTFDLDSMFSTYEFRTNNTSHDLYFYGTIKEHR